MSISNSTCSSNYSHFLNGRLLATTNYFCSPTTSTSGKQPQSPISSVKIGFGQSDPEPKQPIYKPQWLNTNCAQQQSAVHFSTVTRMSLFSLEKRIDYHLSRIMKGHRLINFKNSIERLPADKRICECIIEVLISSSNLITRKTRLIIESKTMVDEFLRSPFPNNEAGRMEYVQKLKTIRTMAINLEQIVWALNSNKEHIKYIVKVFAVPDDYQRSEFLNDPNSIVPLKENIIDCITECKEAILVCRIIRQKMQNVLIHSFINYFQN